jgi:hypothetical protein
MERRLRKARGDEVDDSIEYYSEEEFIAPYPTDNYALEALDADPSALRKGMGCFQKLFLLALSGVIALFILTLVSRNDSNFLNNALGGFISQLPAKIAPNSPLPTQIPIRADAGAILERVRRLQRLETTSYEIEKIIEAGPQDNNFESLLFGDRLLLIAHGTVVAGLDLSNLGPENVTVEHETLTFRLPPVKILNVSLDNSQTRVYDRKKGILAAGDKDLETQARLAAERKILEVACEKGVMARATEDGRRTMEQFLSLLEFKQVVVLTAPVAACAFNP